MVISEQTIFLDLDLKSKEEVFQYISKKAEALEIVKDEQQGLEDLTNREEQVSTGLQDSFAIPHCKSKNVNRVSVLYLELKNPIEWKTFDNSEVRYLFCIMAPEKDGNEKHLQLISKIATNLIDDEFKNELTKLNDKTKIKKLIRGE